MEFHRHLTPRVAWVIALFILTCGFLTFAIHLDRYPAPYFDEAFFNIPAARVIDGGSFIQPEGPAVPYGKLVWAYNAPFFPHLQVLVFRLLGVSTFAARIPSFLSAFLAILLLCAMLIRYRYVWSAVLLPVVWLGDRSMLEAQYGRMDGIALLFLTGAISTFTAWLTAPKKRALFWTGILAGTAMGFHPVAGLFVAGIGLAILVRAQGKAKLEVLYYAMGVAIPIAFALSFYAPHFAEAWTQFRSTAHRAHGDPGWHKNFVHSLTVLRWSRYYALALIALTLLYLLPAGTWVTLKWRSLSVPQSSVVFSTCLFAALGCAAFFTVSQYPYYLIYFSVWPALAVLVMVETHGLPLFNKRAASMAIALLLAAWLPSAAWNALRAREVHMFYPLFDPAHFVRRVRTVIPPDAELQFSMEYFVLARPLAHAKPRPSVALAFELPVRDWLVLSSRDVDVLGGPNADGLRGRTIAWNGRVFPNSDAGGTMSIFTPLPTVTRP